MNREFLHKITILGCLFLLITSSSGTDNGFQTPEQYAQIVQEHFANEEWEAGKELLEEGLQKYPNVSDLEWLMGKYWFHEKNYDQSRYHLVKAIDDNYNNVNAKHLLHIFPDGFTEIDNLLARSTTTIHKHQCLLVM